MNIFYGTDGQVTIKGDEAVLNRVTKGFDVNIYDLTGVKVDADELGRAFNNAEGRGADAANHYVAMKEAFLKKVALAYESQAAPKVSHDPVITSQSIKPVDA